MPSTNTTDLSTELRALWRTRPVRTPDDSKIAGVCGGFGRRYGVDPVLFRIAFVIAAFWGGAGVFLYALAWLLLRAAGDEVSKGESLIGRGRASGSKAAAVVLVVVVLLSAPTFGGSGDTFFVGAGFLMAAAMGVGWYALHRRTPTPPAGWAEVSAVHPVATRSSTAWTMRTTATSGSPTQGAGATQGPGTSQVPGSGPDAPFGPPVPPSWDPLGAAPFAWDLPEPGAAPEPTPAPAKRRSRLTTLTLGVALIAVAVSTGLSVLAGITWLDSTRIAAIALAVVAGGLLVGAVTRRGHGLLVVAGPLAGFVLLASLVQPQTGDLQVNITGPAQLGTPVTHEFGDVTVDMRELDLDHDRSYSITNRAGEVRVLLPEDLDVIATCRTDIGQVDCPEGIDMPGPAGPVLTLDIATGLGDIEVTR